MAFFNRKKLASLFDTGTLNSFTSNADSKKVSTLVNKKNWLSSKLKKGKVNHKISNNKSQLKLKTIDEKAEHIHEEKKLHSEIKKRKARKSVLCRAALVQRLDGAYFRMLNEQLYSMSSTEAYNFFKKDPAAFQAYHQGYQSQRAVWPQDPLNVIVQKILDAINDPENKEEEQIFVADFGCGDARLAEQLETISQKKKKKVKKPLSSKRKNTFVVHSFDLVSCNERVTACDMAHTHLEDKTIDVAVFCLSLMGTNVAEFFLEANRVLRHAGHLFVTEVRSRVERTTRMINLVEKIGFQCENKREDKFFLHLAFVKTSDCRLTHLPEIKLRPSVYRKR